MKKSEKDLITRYIYNNRVRLENNVHQLQSNIRFRNIDIVDCIDLMLAQQELETFKEVTKHIRLLLKLNERNEDNVDTE